MLLLAAAACCSLRCGLLVIGPPNNIISEILKLKIFILMFEINGIHLLAHFWIGSQIYRS